MSDGGGETCYAPMIPEGSNTGIKRVTVDTIIIKRWGSTKNKSRPFFPVLHSGAKTILPRQLLTS